MDYRLVVLGSSGKAVRTEEWECAGDEEALDRAAGQGGAHGAELWQGEHLVSAFAGALTPHQT